MAKCIARATGIDKSREKQVHRLGSRMAKAQAATWHTTACALVMADGSGCVEVTRDGKTIHRFDFDAE